MKFRFSHIFSTLKVCENLKTNYFIIILVGTIATGIWIKNLFSFFVSDH